MLSDEMMEKLLINDRMRNFDMESQAQIMQMFEEIIREARDENVYATISELLDE